MGKKNEKVNLGEQKIAPAVDKLSAKEALEELAMLSETVEFETKYDAKTPLKTLRKLVAEGRKAIEASAEELGAEGEDEDEEADTEEDDGVDEEDEAELEESETPKGKGVHVYTKGGRYVRTYTAKEHGKNFRELAEQFVSKVGREGYTTKEVK